jgi:hypothetical protein
MSTFGAGARTAAAAAAAVVALAFAAALALVPTSGSRPRASELAVGDAYAGGRIVDLRWTADGSQLVAVTQRGESRAAVAVTPDGHRRTVAAHVIGSLDVYPAPAGTRIAMVRTRKNQRARVAVLDVTSPREKWWRWTQAPTTVRWEPGMATVEITDADGCRVFSAYDGQSVAGAACPA